MLRKITFIAAMLLSPAAFANDLQPVMLSVEEYQMVVTALMQRDPVIAALLAKQEQAQKAKQPENSTQPQTSPPNPTDK